MANHQASGAVVKQERFARRVEFLDAHLEVGLLGSDYANIDENGTVLGEVRVFASKRDLRRQMGKRNPFGHSAVMFRRCLIPQWGPHIENNRYR